VVCHVETLAGIGISWREVVGGNLMLTTPSDGHDTVKLPFNYIYRQRFERFQRY